VFEGAWTGRSRPCGGARGRRLDSQPDIQHFEFSRRDSPSSLADLPPPARSPLDQLADALVRTRGPSPPRPRSAPAAPPSTITIESREPETVRSTSENSELLECRVENPGAFHAPPRARVDRAVPTGTFDTSGPPRPARSPPARPRRSPWSAEQGRKEESAPRSWKALREEGPGGPVGHPRGTGSPHGGDALPRFRSRPGILPAP